MKQNLKFLASNKIFAKLMLLGLCAGFASCKTPTDTQDEHHYNRSNIDTMLVLGTNRVANYTWRRVRIVDKSGNKMYKVCRSETAGAYARENDTVLVDRESGEIVEILRHQRMADKFVNGR